MTHHCIANPCWICHPSLSPPGVGVRLPFSGPDSSDVERPVSNREAAASETAQGSTPSGHGAQGDPATPKSNTESSLGAVESGGEGTRNSRRPSGPVFHYVIARKELTGGALLAQVGHGARDIGARWALAHGLPPDDTRIVVLGATKEQLTEVIARAGDFGVTSLVMMNETDGPLAGSTTVASLITADRDLAETTPRASPSVACTLKGTA